MNIRLVILGLMALILGGKLYGQEGSRGRLGILLGGMNGVSYDYSLNSHFEVGASALIMPLGESAIVDLLQHLK